MFGFSEDHLTKALDMPDLSTRIRRVTEDLRAIQEELNEAANSDNDRLTQAMDQMLKVELINEFKAAVDHMRHLLWVYIESTTTGGQRALALQQIRMQRVTEMLRILKPSVGEVQQMNNPETQSFFEVIQSIANEAMDHHDSAKGASPQK